MSTIAVIADIHGNSLALKAVLADLDMQGGADYLVSLGDLAVFGPDPVGVLELLEARAPIFHICGNTDRYLIEALYPAGFNDTTWQQQILASFPWTAQELGPDGIAFLAALPSQQLLRFTSDHVVLAVHGSPRSDEENIKPGTPDGEVAQMLGELPYNLLLCGHTHLPLDRVVAGKRVVNVGSVGLPFDGNVGASYALLHLRPDGRYLVEQRHVQYDVEKVVDQLRLIKHPSARVSTLNLRTARPLADSLIYTQKMRTGQKQVAVLA